MGYPGGYEQLAFCAPRIWNQGKAAGVAHEVRRAFCAPRIWNQGKAGRCLITLIRIFCAPRIWNQGKAGSQIGDWRSQFCAPVFGVKARRDLRLEIGDLNFAPPYLESRQNGISDWRLEISISRPRIWNQGEAGSQIGDWRSQFRAPVFGIKAKRDLRLEIGDLNSAPPYLESRPSGISDWRLEISILCPRSWNRGCLQPSAFALVGRVNSSAW